MPETRFLTSRTLSFLSELKAHNDRDWFNAHRAEFEGEVRRPFLALIEALGPKLAAVDPDFVADPKPVGGSMMRIYRDTRFSKDKSPYKTFLAAHFWHARGKGEASPGFYLHVAPGGSFVGGGVWRPPSPALSSIRDAIVAAPDAWRSARDAALASGATMGGEALKRPPPGYDPADPLIEDLKRKDFIAGSDMSDAEATSERLPDLIAGKLRALAPLVRFLAKAVGLEG